MHEEAQIPPEAIEPQPKLRRAHVMVDIETLGTSDNALVWSIGAVKFDPFARNHRVLDKFYQVIDPATTIPYSKTDISTIMWWMGSNRTQARNQLMASLTVDVYSALEGLSNWFGDVPLPVWGNGATFDLVILKNLYKAVNYPLPWTYKEERCVRTLKNLMAKPPYVSVGTAHNALDDAVAQAFTVQSIVADLGLAEID